MSRSVATATSARNFLQATRWPDRPSLVPEVPAQLAENGRDGVAGEAVAALDVGNPSMALMQSERSDLVEIVE